MDARRLAFGSSAAEVDFVVPESSHHLALLVPEGLLLRYLGEGHFDDRDHIARHFREDARLALQMSPGLQAINYIDPEGVIRIVEPEAIEIFGACKSTVLRPRLGRRCVRCLSVVRCALESAQSVASMADAAPGRFAIGIGSSSNVIVERWNGIPFVEPYKKVRDVVRFLRDANIAVGHSLQRIASGHAMY